MKRTPAPRYIHNAPRLAPGLLDAAPAATRTPSWLPENRSLLLACARHGLFHGWRLLGLPAGSAVLVPAFVCDTVSEPLELAGARLVFFHVHADLSPDLDHAAGLLRGDRRIRGSRPRSSAAGSRSGARSGLTW